MVYPREILHWIEGSETPPQSGEFFDKYNPATGEVLVKVARGQAADVEQALSAAERVYPNWSATPVSDRAAKLRRAVFLVQERQDEIAEAVALEAGKTEKDALAEVGSAVAGGKFFAAAVEKFDDETLTSATPGREVKIRRQGLGVGALFVPVNNPIANIAIKTFPAFLCGNAVVLKAHEDMPYTGVWFGKILKEAGIPDGVFSAIQGFGAETGAALVADKRVQFISFTGSSATGSAIVKATAERLVKVSVEGGGKNPLVVCDDADLERAAIAAVSSAFVDAGQRCAAASRIIVFESIYEPFKSLFVAKASKLALPPLINERKMNEILQAINQAQRRGVIVVTGGHRLDDEERKNGYFIAPTVLENVSPDDSISQQELFGPVTVLYRVKDFDEALKLANNSAYKLTGAIHTQDTGRAQAFINGYQAGVVRVNGPTHGSEPHLPFGGLGLSGNGWRDGGIQALDFYSDWKQISFDRYEKAS